jgi:flagella basal body P-ring formation protein FlgA
MHRLDRLFPTRSRPLVPDAVYLRHPWRRTESIHGLVDRLFPTHSTASFFGLVVLTALILFALPARAEELLPQSLPAIEKTAREFMLKQARAYGGEPQVEIGAPDPRLRLVHCNLPLIAELPPGSRPVGSTTVGVRCPGSTPWSIYVSARVQIFANILVAARPLARGVPLTENDLTLSRQDLAAVPGSALTDIAQALGKRLRYPVATGAALNAGLLDLPPLVKRGQNVTIVSTGQGLEVRATGEALNDGASGETVRVRNLLTKKIIQGTVQDNGLVRVSM